MAETLQAPLPALKTPEHAFKQASVSLRHGQLVEQTKTDRQTDRPTTDKQRDTEKKTERQPDKPTDVSKQTSRHTNGHTNSQPADTDRKKDKEDKDRQANQWSVFYSLCPIITPLSAYLYFS